MPFLFQSGEEFGFQILEHDIQGLDSALCRVLYGRVGKIYDISILIYIQIHHQLILHNELKGGFVSN